MCSHFLKRQQGHCMSAMIARGYLSCCRTRRRLEHLAARCANSSRNSPANLLSPPRTSWISPRESERSRSLSQSKKHYLTRRERSYHQKGNDLTFILRCVNIPMLTRLANDD